MSRSRYEIRQSSDGLWEVIDSATGQIVTLGGLRLEGLDVDAAKGALDVLINEVIEAVDPRPGQEGG